MLDHNDCIAVAGQPPQDLRQLVHVREMKPRGRLIQNVDRLAGAPLAQLRRQLDPLGFSSGKLRGRLPQPDIGKSHIVEGLHLPLNARHMVEEFQRLLDRHVQHVVDGLALVFYFQRLPVVPLSAAHLTGHINVREEMHLDLQDAVAGTGLAPAALYIEAEAALLVASRLRIRRGRKRSRIRSKTPVYVAGLEWGVRPMGD